MSLTFSGKTKNSLARFLMGSKCCLHAELAAFLHMRGSIEIAAGRLALTVVTENSAVVRRVFSLYKEAFAFNTEIFFRKKARLKKNNVYLVQARGEEKISSILKTLGTIDENNAWSLGINKKNISKRCCAKSFLRGAFLASGYVGNPNNSYHLEITTDYLEHGQVILSLMKKFGLKGKISSRKKQYIVYIKGSDTIAEFLKVIGAHDALFSFENTRVVKDMRNQVNRLINFETANLDKTVEAAIKQAEEIKLIQSTIGLDKLPKNIKPLAQLRLAHPESSLLELGKMLNPPLGKSGVNHRFRKIKQIAESIKDKK